MSQQPNNPYSRSEWDAARNRHTRANRRPQNPQARTASQRVHEQHAQAQMHGQVQTQGAPYGRAPQRRTSAQQTEYARAHSGHAPQPHMQQRATSRSAQTGYARTARPYAQGARTAQTAEYNDYSRYINQRQKRRRKSPVAIVVSLLLLVGIGVGVYFFLNPPTFEVTVNGVKQTVNRGATLETVIDEGMATPNPGNLLAIDGSVIQEGGGNKFAATVNDTAVENTADALAAALATPLSKNDVIEITNGTDATESFQTTTEEVPFQRVEDDNYWNGSLHVYTKGVNGVRTTKTGDVSGITITEDTQPVVNEGYRIYTANTNGDKVIALTFDDGPWPTTTDEILDILDQYDAKATFFTIGNQLSQHTDSVKRAYESGHQICTHTWDHASGSGQGVNLTYMSADEQITEVQKGIEAIKEVIGAEPSHVIRAPGGNFHGDIVWTLEPYITAEIGWNIDTEDWRRPGADAIAQRILKAQPGDVILMHDGGGDRSQTVEALRQALPKLKEEGYKFVTVDELLAYGIPNES